MHKVQWIVGLSNGETITEGKGNFAEVTGELSPWQKLLAYVQEKGVTITSLSLYTADGKRWNLPSSGKNPKFHAFSIAKKPTGYKMFRKVGADIMNGKPVNEDLFTCAEAQFEDGSRLQIWVDESSEKSWTLILKAKQ